MSDVKTFMFPENGNSDAALLAMNGGGAWANNPIWALAFLGIFANGGLGGGYGGGRSQLDTIQAQLQTIQGQNSLMSAITGGTNEVRSLANTINCDYNAVQTAINGVQAAICAVGNQVGMGTAQVINSINNGNMSLANTLQSCCCEVKQLVTTQGYENRINNIEQSNMITKGFGDIAYGTQAQTTALAANQDANTRAILGKLDQIEDSRKDEKIADLTAKLTAATSRAERQTELAPIYKAIEKIPNTVPVQWPQLTAVPTNYLYGFGYGYGQQGNVFS